MLLLHLRGGIIMALLALRVFISLFLLRGNIVTFLALFHVADGPTFCGKVMNLLIVTIILYMSEH